MDRSSEPSQLSPLAYQHAVNDCLNAEDPAVWRWFAEQKDSPAEAAKVRLDLLKSTYRIERQTQPDLYALADDAAATLGLKLPLTIYQAQHHFGLNAWIAYLPGEAHLVLCGPMSTMLSPLEMKALVGHELGHRLLYDQAEGENRVAAQMLAALANEPQASPVYAATARLYSLYSELFCDRAAWLVSRDLAATVAMLVKVSTGLADVSAASYLRQADEIFSHGAARTEEITHPESFIRARALRLWVEQADGATEAIAAMLEAPLALRELDLLGQRRVAALTRRLIDQLLLPEWFQSERVLAHARSFFEDYAGPPDNGRPVMAARHNGGEASVALAAAKDGNEIDDGLAGDIATGDRALQDYYGYILLDFATVDPDLEDLPLAAALVLARRLGLAERFKEIVLKEMRLTKKRYNELEKNAHDLLTEAARKD